MARPGEGTAVAFYRVASMDNLPFPPHNERMELKFPLRLGFQGESFMQAAIDRVMHTYGMLVNLSSEQEQVA
jgi:hypothetical protein